MNAIVIQSNNIVKLVLDEEILLEITEPNAVVAENTSTLILMDLHENNGDIEKTIKLHQHRLT
jgi:hypothetical protein